MLKYFTLVAVLLNVAFLTVHAEQRFIKEIKEGPYQNYSGQPLVDLGGHYYFFETNDVTLLWSEATLFCSGLGLSLVSIENAYENDLIKNYVFNYLAPRNYWTSGSLYNLATQTWVWTSTGRVVEFTDWYPGEPSNTGGEDTIVVWEFEGGVYNWNDYPRDGDALWPKPTYACCEAN